MSCSAQDAVLETLRMTCLSFGALRLVVGADSDLGEHGDILTVSHLAQGRDATVFYRPHEWNPSFNPGDVSFCFGGGQHACPGKKIALSSMAVIVETLLPHISHIDDISPLMFDRPSLAERKYCYVRLKEQVNL
jgi:cytochrome P450